MLYFFIGSGLISSSDVLIAYNLLSSGANLYSPLKPVEVKYPSKASVRVLWIIFLESSTKVHLSPGGTLVAINSLCSITYVSITFPFLSLKDQFQGVCFFQVCLQLRLLLVKLYLQLKQHFVKHFL